jgi:DNA end-binding protein Ku
MSDAGALVQGRFSLCIPASAEAIMKAIWKGYLKCSLVTIPVKMFNAVSRRAIQFNLLHKECGSRIKQEMVCPVHHKPLSPDEVVRGYQYGKDLHVIITDEDLQRAQRESTDSLEIVKFVEEEQIHPVYYAESHYLAPDGQAGLEAFALFHRGMLETKKTALAKMVLRNREHLLNLRPYGGALIAFTLHYPEEILQVGQVEGVGEVEKLPVNQDHLELAKSIIAHLSGDFVPGQYRDEYTQTLLEIIKAKAEGKEFQVAPRVEREKVVSLMEALKKSLEEVKPAGKEAPEAEETATGASRAGQQG